MAVRYDIIMVVFGVLLLMKPQAFAYVMMNIIAVFEQAFGTSSGGSDSSGEDYSEFTSWQEDVKAFQSQVVDPQAQYHDQWGI